MESSGVRPSAVFSVGDVLEHQREPKVLFGLMEVARHAGQLEAPALVKAERLLAADQFSHQLDALESSMFLAVRAAVGRLGQAGVRLQRIGSQYKVNGHGPFTVLLHQQVPVVLVNGQWEPFEMFLHRRPHLADPIPDGPTPARHQGHTSVYDTRVSTEVTRTDNTAYQIEVDGLTRKMAELQRRLQERNSQLRAAETQIQLLERELREGANRVNIDETVERIISAEREAIRKRALADLTPQLNEAHRRADELETKLMLEQLRWEQEMKALRFKLAAEKAQAIADARVDADREAAAARKRGNEINENRFYELQARYDSLVSEVEMLRAKSRSGDENVDEWKRRADERTREVDAAAVRLLEAEKGWAQERLRMQRDHRAEMEGVENTLRDSWREAEAEVRRMHDRAQEERARNHAAAMAEERRAREQLQDEIAVLRRHLEEANAERDRANRELSSSRDQVSQQIREIEDLHAQLRQAQDEAARRLMDDKDKASKDQHEQRQRFEDKIRALEGEVRALRTASGDAERERDAEREKARRAEDRCAALEAEAEAAKETIRQLRADLEAERDRAAALQRELDQALADLSRAGGELDRERSVAGEAGGELARLREDLKDAAARVKLLEDELGSLKREQDGVDGQLATFEAANQDLEGQLAVANSRIAELETQLRMAEAALVAAKEAGNAEDREKAAHAEQEAAEAKDKGLKALEEARARAAEDAARIKALEADLAAAQEARDAEEAARIKALEAELAAAQEALAAEKTREGAQGAASSAAMSVLQGELEEGRASWAAEMEKLRAEMAEMERKHEEAENHCRAEKERLRREIDDLKELVAKRDQRIKDLEAELSILRGRAEAAEGLMQQAHDEEEAARRAAEKEELERLEREASDRARVEAEESAAIEAQRRLEEERLRKLASDEAHAANAMYRADVAEWFNELLGTDLNEANLIESLADGEYLCELANLIDGHEEETRAMDEAATASKAKGKASPSPRRKSSPASIRRFPLAEPDSPQGLLGDKAPSSGKKKKRLPLTRLQQHADQPQMKKRRRIPKYGYKPPTGVSVVAKYIKTRSCNYCNFVPRAHRGTIAARQNVKNFLTWTRSLQLDNLFEVDDLCKFEDEDRIVWAL